MGVEGDVSMSGAELLALYGEDGEALGKFLPGLKKFAKKAMKFTPQYLAYRGLKKAFPGKKKAAPPAAKPPQYWKSKGIKKVFTGEDGAMEEILGAAICGDLSGEDIEYLGAFLPGLKKVVKKIGKVTSKITTAAARVVGIPQSAINALAKVDPTKLKAGAVTATAKKAIEAAKVLTAPPQKITAVSPAAAGITTKKVLVVGGAAVGGIILISLIASFARPRSRR